MREVRIRSLLFFIMINVLPKDTDKRARNKKLASLFFTASASIFEVYLKDSVLCLKHKEKRKEIKLEIQLYFSYFRL